MLCSLKRSTNPETVTEKGILINLFFLQILVLLNFFYNVEMVMRIILNVNCLIQNQSVPGIRFAVHMPRIRTCACVRIEAEGCKAR